MSARSGRSPETAWHREPHRAPEPQPARSAEPPSQACPQTETTSREGCPPNREIHFVLRVAANRAPETKTAHKTPIRCGTFQVAPDVPWFSWNLPRGRWGTRSCQGTWGVPPHPGSAVMGRLVCRAAHHPFAYRGFYRLMCLPRPLRSWLRADLRTCLKRLCTQEAERDKITFLSPEDAVQNFKTTEVCWGNPLSMFFFNRFYPPCFCLCPFRRLEQSLCRPPRLRPRGKG